jgi:uncharacterized protein (TIGR03067 family)
MRLASLLLAVCALGFAPAPFMPKPAPKAVDDLKLLQGEWVQIKQSLGSPLRDSRDGSTAVFTGERIQFKSNGKTTASWTIKLQPGAKPKQLDLRGRGAANFILCIYSLEGKTFTLCWNNSNPTLNRPGDFTTQPGRGVTVFRRR